MINKLKPCPWCREIPSITKDTDSKLETIIFCENINCIVNPSTDWIVNRDNAISIWNALTVNNWVSIEEAVPDPFEVQVLIWPPIKIKGYSDINCCFYGRRYSNPPWFYIYGRVLYGITHWQYLPKGPV